MDRRPVAVERGGDAGSWRLAPPHAAAVQGLVVSGFAALPTGRALFLEFTWPDDGARGRGEWVNALATVAPITPADGPQPRAAALAITYAGLARMGLEDAALASFAAPFREGMLQEDRLRRLGDRRKGEWLGTVRPGGPRWSANTPQRGAIGTVEAARADGPLTVTGHREEAVATPITVHALLMLYDADEANADARAAAVESALAPHDVRIVHRLPLELMPDTKGVSREHFGFADGLSQPIPYDAQDDAAAPSPDRDPWNGVPLGEILLGHVNGHHEPAPGPVAPVSDRTRAAGLALHPTAQGFCDLGLDGSYMVVRELTQDVAAFWRSMDDDARRIRERDPAHSAHVTPAWLAERVVGRNVEGHLLCPGGYLAADASNRPANDFGFFERDRQGGGCPLGSHVRRANPRDGLAPTAKDRQALLDAANNHRLLRRGRKFGAPPADPGTPDGVDRGLLFVCLNTDIARQFEFVQQTWLLNPNFATLYDEQDPLIGPRSPMTIREEPLRRIVTVDTFVQLAGGDYFFLPSLPALRYFASL